MAELNNRKRKLSSEKTGLGCEENAIKKQDTNENASVNVEVETDSDTTSATKSDDTQLISKSAIKSFSRLLPRNVVGTIGRKTALFTKRTLRLRTGTRRCSLQTSNQGWDTISTLSCLEDNINSQGETTKKQNQALSINYTLKLRKLKEKFKTTRQLKKDRLRSVKINSCKELNQSKVDNNKQGKLLEKLLEKHNKHLESL